MEDVRLGKTELTVTRLGLGGVQLARMSTPEAEPPCRLTRGPSVVVQICD